MHRLSLDSIRRAAAAIRAKGDVLTIPSLAVMIGTETENMREHIRNIKGLAVELGPIEKGRIGRPKDASATNRYHAAASQLRKKRLEVNLTNLAVELKKRRRAVETFLRRNPKLSAELVVLMRESHTVEDYRATVRKLISDGMTRVTQARLATELGLSKRGTVTRFLDAHPELRAEFPTALKPRRFPGIKLVPNPSEYK